MILEVCANSYQSAINAAEAGAHRIELCSELSVGGITPSYGLLKKVIQAIVIPVFVLIRPRSGDFVFSEGEYEIMKHDIEMCKNLGCKGIVSGVLNKNNTVDIERTKALVALSKPLDFTFHRAFDLVDNPFKSLEGLIDIGVNRVLTSGQETTAEKGLGLLKQLNKKSKNIMMLPGSGINPENAKLFKDSGFQEIHASASRKFSRNNVAGFGDNFQTESDVNIIKSILRNIS